MDIDERIFFLNGQKVTREEYDSKHPEITSILPEKETHLISNHIINCMPYQVTIVMRAYEQYALGQEGYIGCEIAENKAIYAFRGYGKADLARSDGYLSNEYYLPDSHDQNNRLPYVYNCGLSTYTLVVTAEAHKDGVMFTTDIYDSDYKLDFEIVGHESMSAESIKIKVGDAMDTIYQEYILSVLIPKYGILHPEMMRRMTTEYEFDSVTRECNGMISAAQVDIDSDSIDEVIILRCEEMITDYGYRRYPVFVDIYGKQSGEHCTIFVITKDTGAE